MRPPVGIFEQRMIGPDQITVLVRIEPIQLGRCSEILARILLSPSFSPKLIEPVRGP